MQIRRCPSTFWASVGRELAEPDSYSTYRRWKHGSVLTEKAALILNVPHQVGILRSRTTSAAFPFFARPPFPIPISWLRALVSCLQAMLTVGDQMTLFNSQFQRYSHKWLKIYLKILQFVLRSKMMNMHLRSLAHKDIGNRHYGWYHADQTQVPSQQLSNTNNATARQTRDRLK